MPADKENDWRLRDYDLAEAAIREAGTLASAYFHGAPQTWAKADDSPVSEADLAVDRQLRRRLGAARPDYGWISEEVEDDPQRLDKARCWVIDPIDGTRAFLSGVPEWVISVALVEAGTPILGLLFNPQTQELFSAIRGDGAKLNGAPIQASQHDQIDNARIIATSKMRRTKWRTPWPPMQTSYVNSLAYRIARVGTGQADATLALSRFHEWDIAAADLILTEAGGTFTDLSGLGFRYNQPSLRRPGCIGANPGLHQKLVDFIAGNLPA
ncbi:MAG: 3'(2'),5'-bisphosphate nucleotidase CysQ [Hyphomicrobiales bacterium]